jgi:hypothetical protein
MKGVGIDRTKRIAAVVQQVVPFLVVRRAEPVDADNRFKPALSRLFQFKDAGRRLNGAIRLVCDVCTDAVKGRGGREALN